MVEKTLSMFLKSINDGFFIPNANLLFIYNIDFSNEEEYSIKNFVKFYIEHKEELIDIKKISFKSKSAINEINLFDFTPILDINLSFQNIVIENIICTDKDSNILYIEIKNSIDFIDCSIKYIDLSFLTISKKIYFMNIKDIKDFLINNTLFIENIEISDSTIHNLKIHKSKFNKSLHIINSNINNYVDFSNSSILEYSDFSFSIFNNGLDLSKFFIKESVNFYKIDVNGNQTNRETYRIIKQSFLSNGNRIEANKFYSKEMEAREKEFKTNTNLETIYRKNSDIKKENNRDKYLISDYLIFKIYKYTSNFSQSPITVIFWLLFTELILSGIYAFTLNKVAFCNPLSLIIIIIFSLWSLIALYIFRSKTSKENKKSLIKSGFLITAYLFYFYVSNVNFEYFFKFINILSTETTYSGFLNNFLFYINKIILGYLMYQFLISVRKDTKEL